MPEYLAPGVYVEETSYRPKSIEGVSTTTTGRSSSRVSRSPRICCSPHPRSTRSGITMTITIGYILLAIIVSSVIGMIAGIYPAFKAARLDPIIALTKTT